MPLKNLDSQGNKTKKKIRPKKETNEISPIAKPKNIEPPAPVIEASRETQENETEKKIKPKKENEISSKDEETEKLEKVETEAVTETPNINKMEAKSSPPETTEVLDEKQQSRYGRVRKNRSLGPDMQMEPLVKPKLAKDGTPTKEDSPNTGNIPKKSHHPSFSKAKVDKILNGMTLMTEELKLGDLIWARIPGHPWWPCIISEDPVKKTHIKSRNSKKKILTKVVRHSKVST